MRHKWETLKDKRSGRFRDGGKMCDIYKKCVHCGLEKRERYANRYHWREFTFPDGRTQNTEQVNATPPCTGHVATAVTVSEDERNGLGVHQGVAGGGECPF